MIQRSPRPSAAAVRRSRRAWPFRVAIAIACLATITVCADEPAGLFLPTAEGGPALWRRTLAAVSAEWPVTRVVEPDFVSGREGAIESAWVEPPGALLQSWPPQRQRVLVRVVPAPGGAWIDAAVQTPEPTADDPDGNLWFELGFE